MISYYKANYVFALVMVMVSGMVLPMEHKEATSVNQQTTTNPSDDFWHSLVGQNIPLQSFQALDYVTAYGIEHARDEAEACLLGKQNLERLIQEGLKVNEPVGQDATNAVINPLMRIVEAVVCDWNDVIDEHSEEKKAHFQNYVQDYVVHLMQILLEHGADPHRVVAQQELSTPLLYAHARLRAVQNSGTWSEPLLGLLGKGILKPSQRSAFSPARGRNNSPSAVSASQGSLNQASLSQVSLASLTSLSSVSLERSAVEIRLQDEYKEPVTNSPRSSSVDSTSSDYSHDGRYVRHCRSCSAPVIMLGCGHAS